MLAWNISCISIGEEIAGFGLRAADFETVAAYGIFFTIQPDLPGRELG